MTKSLKWLLLCMTMIGVYNLVLFFEHEPAAVNFIANITSKVVKKFDRKSSTIEVNTKSYSEKKIIITKGVNNKRIVRYDSRENDYQELNNIYKWKDSSNILIISSEPPPSNVGYEIFYYRKAGSALSVSSNVKINSIGKNSLSKPISNNPIRVYTPDGLRELIKQSKDIGEQLELRGELFDELSELL